MDIIGNILTIDCCYNLDCNIGMQMMKEQGLIADWCITDPPYNIGFKAIMGGDGKCKVRDYMIKDWDNKRIEKPTFDLMAEVSKEQIIFGGNYYTDILPPTKSWVIWDKRCTDVRNDYADCEMAWCSTGVARVFRYLYQGMLQGNMKDKDPRFHPTAKPTHLWYMLLNFYTKEGDLILDPFAGSQSLRIACYKLNRRYIGFELDKEYFDKGTQWFNEMTKQISMFD